MSFTINDPVFAQIREGAHPNGLNDIQLGAVIDLLADIPTFSTNLSDFQNQPGGGQIRFGADGEQTHLSPDGTRIFLDPNDFDSMVFSVTAWARWLVHETAHFVSPGPNTNALPSFDAAIAEGVREEARAEAVVYVGQREANAAGIPVVFLSDEQISAIESRFAFLSAGASTSEKIDVATSALVPFYTHTYMNYGNAWAAENSSTAPAIIPDSLVMVDFDGDGRVDLIRYQVTGVPSETSSRISIWNPATDAYMAVSGDTFIHAVEHETGVLSTGTWLVGATGHISAMVERSVEGKSISLTFEMEESGRFVVTGIQIGGVVLTNHEEAASALNYAGLTPQDFATRPFEGLPSPIDAIADIIRHFDPAAPLLEYVPLITGRESLEVLAV